MHAIWSFVKSTLVGGLLVLLPAYLAVLLLLKGVQGLTALVKPLANHLPIEAEHHTIFAIALIILVSFLIGLALKTWPGKRMGNWFTTEVLGRIPGYSVIRSVMRRSFGDESSEFKVAFVEIEEALVVGYVVEEHDDGRYTVFVPASPTPFSGAVYVLTPERVHIVDVPFLQAFQAMTKWGNGTRDLIKAMDQQEAAKAP
jgi:uncharacterized membrane protein